MRYPPRGASLFAIGLISSACGSSNGAPLFGHDPADTGEDASAGTGSNASSATGGYGGSGVTGSGGMPETGGVSGAGSAGVGLTGSGGVPQAGGASSSGSGGSGLTGSGGMPELDAGSDAGGPKPDVTSPPACDYTGTWGTYIQVPVSWPDAPFVLLGGTGTLQQWNLTEQVQQGLDVHLSTVPCMIVLPDLQGSLLAGFYKYGIRFPPELFDGGGIPPTEFVLQASVTPSGISLASDPFAILVGLTMTNPTTTTWPGAHSLSLEDHDSNNSPGITVIPAVDQGYSRPPADLVGNYADRVYIAERTVSRLSGTLAGCDQVELDVDVISVGGQSGIQSSVVGCHLESGVDCTQEQADFVDGIRPQYTPTGAGTSVSVRMPPGSTCTDVRAMFPAQ